MIRTFENPNIHHPPVYSWRLSFSHVVLLVHGNELVDQYMSEALPILTPVSYTHLTLPTIYSV